MNARASVPELELITTSVAQTMSVAERLAGHVQAGDVIGLVGELGAGKTQFVRGLARGLGLDPRQVSSPTFVLMHEYEPDTHDRPTLVHIDAYRLSAPEELATLGWGDAGCDLRRDAVVVVEWADVVAPMLEPDWLRVAIHHEAHGERRLTFAPLGDWRQRGLTIDAMAPH